MKNNFFLSYKIKSLFLKTLLGLLFSSETKYSFSTLNNSRCFITMPWFEIWEWANKTTRSTEQFHKNIFSNKVPQDRETENAYILDSESHFFSFFFFQGATAAWNIAFLLRRTIRACMVHNFSCCSKSTMSHCFTTVSWGKGKMLLVV